MDSSLYDIRRDYRIPSFMVGERPRFIFENTMTLVPSVAVSLYEQYLSYKKGSYNSVNDDLDKIAYLYTWANRENIDIEELLLNGYAPQPIQVRAFAYWLSQIDNISLSTYNRVLDVSAAIFVWFIMHYGEFEGRGNKHQLDREKVASSTQALFRNHKKPDRKKRIAEDMSEEDIATIENYLKPENRAAGVDEATAKRDYLMWRLAIEFGFRASEILALRLCDCPHGKQQFIKIVRIEERGKDYHDPRGPRMPRPKTLSRDLGFLIENSPIPELISDYVSEYRSIVVLRNGKITKQPVLKHEFLAISHMRKSGAPLSESGMQRVAQRISEKTGVTFHWHLARHAFFNRAYLSIVNHPELKDKLLDLVYWGGWSDEKSLQLYVNRARRHRATTALVFWQTGTNTWDALK